jgi:hypothetical protein
LFLSFIFDDTMVSGEVELKVIVFGVKKIHLPQLRLTLAVRYPPGWQTRNQDELHAAYLAFCFDSGAPLYGCNAQGDVAFLRCMRMS